MRKGELTRQRIVELAAPIFNRKGFEGAALSDLMAATGLGKGGIYRHFASKEELAAESFEYAWKAAMRLRFAGIEAIPNSVDRLAQLIRNFSERREGLVAGGCPLLNTAIDSDDGNAALRARARKALAGWAGRIRRIAREGQRRGEIRAEIDCNGLAKLMVGTLEGSLMVSRLEGDRAPVAAACAHLLHYLEASIRARPTEAIRPSPRARRSP